MRNWKLRDLSPSQKQRIIVKADQIIPQTEHVLQETLPLHLQQHLPNYGVAQTNLQIYSPLYDINQLRATTSQERENIKNRDEEKIQNSVQILIFKIFD